MVMDDEHSGVDELNIEIDVWNKQKNLTSSEY